MWQFRALSEPGVPVYGSHQAQWLNGATSQWDTLQVGPAPSYSLPTFSTPTLAPVTGSSVSVALGAFEYAFVVIPDAGVSACA